MPPIRQAGTLSRWSGFAVRYATPGPKSPSRSMRTTSVPAPPTSRIRCTTVSVPAAPPPITAIRRRFGVTSDISL